MSFRKATIFFLVTSLLTSGLLTSKVFVPVAKAFETAATVIGLVALDNHVKYLAKKNKSKNGTSTEYVPADGYGEDDKYWKWSDIEAHFKDNFDQYSFKNENAPFDAIASLPSETANGLRSGGVAIASVATNPIEFPWTAMKPMLRKGDIFFVRGDDWINSYAQYYTSWVHLAMVYDLNKNWTFESNLARGANIYNPIDEWGAAYSWSVKRVKDTEMNTTDVAKAIDAAKSRYAGTPYWPTYVESWITRGSFISKWADKFDSDSMYCSKLVWRTYYDAGVDLDSERTSSFIDSNFMNARMDNGLTNMFAWIGVSGDDIYYSKHVGRDIYTYGLDNLAKPIPGWLVR